MHMSALWYRCTSTALRVCLVDTSSTRPSRVHEPQRVCLTVATLCDSLTKHTKLPVRGEPRQRARQRAEGSSHLALLAGLLAVHAQRDASRSTCMELLTCEPYTASLPACESGHAPPISVMHSLSRADKLLASVRLQIGACTGLRICLRLSWG